MTQRGGLVSGDPVGRADWFSIIPFEPAVSSDRLGWAGLSAAHYRATPAHELSQPALAHHMLVLFTRPPDEFALRYDGVKRFVPPPAGAIQFVPAGNAVQVRSSGVRDQLHVCLEPGLVARVATEVFAVDEAPMALPPLDGADVPHLRATLAAVDAELNAGGPGGGLAAESLANALAIQLVRHVMAPHRREHGRDGTLPQSRLRAVVDYVEAHLGAGPTLEQLAAIARLSPYHFARQFKAATGLPPHQFVIARRIERARQLLQAGTDRSLAEVAAAVGFSDQSQFSRHFKRLVGATPRQFRSPASID